MEQPITPTRKLIVLPKSRHILVPLTDSIRSLWPTTPTLPDSGTTYAVLPHDPRTQIQLRAAGIDAPAPILFHYDWHSADGSPPFEIQKTSAASATSNQRAYNLSDMGTGKTRTALWSWRYLHELGISKKLLVVAPLSTLKFTWLSEITRLMPQYKAVVLHGLKKRRLELLAGNYDIYIINHDGLRTIADELHAREDIDCLVIDELAVYRNNSQRSKLMREFVKRFVWCWGMTGRPMPNAVTDVWAQAKILTPHRVPKFFRHAKSMLMTQVSQYKWVAKEGAIDLAFSWLQPSVRYSLDDVVELPPAIMRTVDVELTSEQRTAYRKLSNFFAAEIKDKRVTAANAGVALGKLLQVGAGYVYTNNPEYVVLDSQPRQEMLLEVIEEADHKLIVFCPWRHLIDNLSALLSNQKEPIDHAVVHGDTRKREEIFNAFQNTSQYKVLLAHPQTVHHGLTLTAATTTVWYSPVTSLEVYEQAQARIRRVGQKHKQLFLHFRASPIETHVYSMLRNKARLQDAFLALLKEVTDPKRRTVQ